MCELEECVKDAVSLCPTTCTECEPKSKGATSNKSNCRLDVLPTIAEHSTPISQMEDQPAASRLTQVLTETCVQAQASEKYMPCCNGYSEAVATTLSCSSKKRRRISAFVKCRRAPVTSPAAPAYQRVLCDVQLFEGGLAEAG